MKCSNCQAEVPVDARFCPYCGQEFEQAATNCASCGKELGPGQKFCPHCGARVQSPEIEQPAQSLISVTPIVEETTPAENASPEDADLESIPDPTAPSSEPVDSTTVPEPTASAATPEPVEVTQGPADYRSPPLSTSCKVEKENEFPWKIALSIGCLFSIFICGGIAVAIVVLTATLATMPASTATNSAKTPQAVQVDTKSTPSVASMTPTSANSTPTAVKSTPAPANATPTRSASSTAVRLQNTALGLGLDSDQKVTDPTTTINKDTQKIYLSTEVLNVKDETEVWVSWYYLDTNSKVDGPSQYINEDSRLGFSLSKPTNGWPVGQYKAVIYVNNVEAGSINFTCN